MAAVMFWDSIQIGWIFYIILVGISLFILFVMGGYMVWNYHLGKPLSPFFWLRLKSWTQKSVSLFEIFSLTNTVSLEEARKEKGDGYRLYIPTTVEIAKKKQGFWAKNINKIFGKNPYMSTGTEKIKRIQNLIFPKSSYSINGVNTVLLYDLHPQLHIDILEGIKILISQDITTLEELKAFVDKSIENSEKNLFKNYNYRVFLDLYLGVKQKFNISVSTDSVISMVGHNFDKNFRESLECKDFNYALETKQSGKTMLYGYIIIGIAVAAIAFKIVYQTLYS